MGLFNKSIVKESRIIDSDETLQWHIENQDDENKYIDIRSKFTDFKNSKFLKRVNALIKIGYKP